MPDCKQYSRIDRIELDSLRKDLAKENVHVPEGDDVEVKGPFGIELRATYDEQKQSLKVCITKKPFFVPEFKVWEIVDEGTAPYIG
ncbi:MAG: hypothetical protein H7070_03820 [Saprospiraceae bacterium]|nr:hypothetical protein [Pyrinomonadaceae bacterium]